MTRPMRRTRLILDRHVIRAANRAHGVILAVLAFLVLRDDTLLALDTGDGDVVLAGLAGPLAVVEGRRVEVVAAVLVPAAVAVAV